MAVKTCGLKVLFIRAGYGPGTVQAGTPMTVNGEGPCLYRL